MKKILFCLPLLLLALQSCEIEDEYMYDKGLYTIDWDAAADSSSVTLIDRFWNTEENYFNYGNDGSIKDFHYSVDFQQIQTYSGNCALPKLVGKKFSSNFLFSVALTGDFYFFTL